MESQPLAPPIALFLFAHQDDEVPLYRTIEDCMQNGQRPLFLYFTVSDSGQNSEIRCRESLAALAQLGVAADQIFFIGQEQGKGIPDGKLHEHFELALSEAQKIIGSLGSSVQSIHVCAWEGGHQDHDSANLLGRVLAHSLGCTNSLWQAPFYHGCGLPWILFKVLSPLEQNGTVLTEPMSVRQRLRYLKLCFVYKSQRKTWCGLLPFFFIDYLVDGRSKLQAVPISDTFQKPHLGSLLYERRKFCRFDDFAAFALRFIKAHLGVE